MSQELRIKLFFVASITIGAMIFTLATLPGCIRDRTPVIHSPIEADSLANEVRGFTKYDRRPDGAYVAIDGNTVIIQGKWEVMRNGEIVPE